MLKKTLDDLEWERIVMAVASRCRGPRSGDPELPLARTREEARQACGEAHEARRLLDAGDPLPLDALADVRPHLSRLDRRAALDAPGIRDIRSMLRAARVLRIFLARHRESAPMLFHACPVDPTLDELAEELDESIDSDGTLRDSASADLARLRVEVSNLRTRIVARLEDLIVKNAAILSDRFHTIREGRYVLPVRTDAHERFAGIVHGTSASGATIFVEPRGLVAQGNRLKMAQGEMEREQERILAALSERICERIAEVRAAVDALDHADLRAASALFGRDLGGHVLTIPGEPRARLVGARHPVLLLDGSDVVANDIAVKDGRALVLSGPNAGGKTVALKVLGLAALMTRAGLPFPAEEGSECGFFDPVLTDVGDEQSIEKNLSTFSAHVSNLVRMLDAAEPGALVLLDELAGGTDPVEGAALACAVVGELCARGAAVAVTTHYEALKAMAMADERLANASVGFDVDKMEPTFRLVPDVPGPSSALAVAARFGMPATVIEAARRALPEQARTFDELVRELALSRQRLDEERRAVAEERQALAAQRAALDADRAELDRTAEASRHAARNRIAEDLGKLRADLGRAHDEMKDARRAMKRGDARELEEARRRLREASGAVESVEARLPQRASAVAPRGEAATADALREGVRVWVERLRAEAEVVETPRRGRVRIAAGAMRLTVGVDDVRVLSRSAEPGDGAAPVGGKRAQRGAPDRGAPIREGALRTRDNTIDVRGMRVDEALGMVDAYLDRLYGADEPTAFIVHGAGTYALRDALRDHLGRGHDTSESTRAGTEDEGGDGVTVVKLR